MKQLALACMTGLLLAISWPTYGFPIFLFFAFVPLLFAKQNLKDSTFATRKVFGLAYLAFLIWNLITTWWIYNATYFGVAVAVLVNSLLMAVVFLLYHVVSRKTSEKISAIFLVTAWMGFEYFHLQWQLSWPWLNLGNGFAGYTSWVQWYAYTGTFGGTLWVWVANFASYFFLKKYLKTKSLKQFRTEIIGIVAIWILPIICSLAMYYSYSENGKSIEVLLLQPNINPYTEKYNNTDKRIADLLTELTLSEITPNTQFIIAPETVFADRNRLNRFGQSTAKKMALQLLERYPNAHLIAGISMIDVFKDSSRVRKQTNVHKDHFFYDDYNSAFFVRPDGKSALYHKSKLVVGVENFPYQNILKPLLGDIMIDLGGTVAKKTTQSERAVFFTKDSIGVGTMICYESIYGEFSSGFVANKANFLALITNDAWWGNTQGHLQHLHYAKLRAIETRRSIARSANTGISAIINQKGDLVQQLEYERKGALKGRIFLGNRITFYTKYGNYLPRIAIFLSVFIFISALVNRSKFKKNANYW